MKLLSRESCFKLLKKYGYRLPGGGGSRHFLIVNKIAVFLAEKLKEKGVNINIDLVDRASLLHDIDKGCILHDGEHGEKGYKILLKEGYPEIAEVVKDHLFTSLIKIKNFSWESKIVNYADCRVRHNNIVPIEERLDDVKKRYTHLDPANIDKVKPILIELEKEIFGKIKMKPEDLEKVIK